jgi:uncharacterized protein YlxP (DUF503 family)
MIVKSLVSKIRNKFNVSVAQIQQQDVHQTIVIAIAAISDNTALSDSITDNIINFIEDNTQAQIVSIQREIR